MGRKTLIILNATLVSLSRREAKLVLHETVKSDKRFSEVAIIKAYISGSLPPQLRPRPCLILKASVTLTLITD